MSHFLLNVSGQIQCVCWINTPCLEKYGTTETEFSPAFLAAWDHTILEYKKLTCVIDQWPALVDFYQSWLVTYICFSYFSPVECGSGSFAGQSHLSSWQLFSSLAALSGSNPHSTPKKPSPILHTWVLTAKLFQQGPIVQHLNIPSQLIYCRCY